MNRGIDYGMGRTNIDGESGIRYGVIPQNDVLEVWADESEPNYGPPSCPKCGNDATAIDDPTIPDLSVLIPDGWEDNGREYACLNCEYSFDSDEAYGEEPLSWYVDDGEYLAEQSADDCNVFVVKSPYYTRAQFCSPCAPGACYLRNPCPDGDKAYCFAPDWFDWFAECGEEPAGEYNGEKTSCPYPVYRVEDDECVYRPYGHEGE